MKLFGRSPAAPAAAAAPLRLHVGCGTEALPAWINIDNKALPGVDRVLDVTAGLPFRDVAAIYAEHFLEHLSLDQGLAFLAECRRVLADQGVLRLSTPNLDWVYATHYRLTPSSDERQPLVDCFQLNRAFRGWGHQFLYNGRMLEAVLHAAGFASVRFHRYGESEIPELRGLERHETWEDTPDMPHVIVAEAAGRGVRTRLPADLVTSFREAIEAR
jgi:predicted SAM-dependent methyltransferase